MTRIETILGEKPIGLITIGPEAKVLEALELMAEHDIGALVVLEDGVLAGLFSERDYARKVMLRGKSSRFASVGGIMRKDPPCVAKDESIEHCMGLMTRERVRHLPVLEGSRVLGLISLGDVVKSVITMQAEEIEALHTFIHS
ncbi:MAG: CBS domain-containing protein [Myxococcota bacterium]